MPAASIVASLRPAGADHLGLRRALSDRLLPLLVGAMVFLAALALAGAMAAAALAAHWKLGAASMVTITVPMPDAPQDGTVPAPQGGIVAAPAPQRGPGAAPVPDGIVAAPVPQGGSNAAAGGAATVGGAAAGGATRADAATRVLAASPGVVSARRVPSGEMAQLLKPWLGADVAALGLHLPAMFEVRVGPGGLDPALAQRLARVAPGSLVERNGQWLTRLNDLVRSLQACAALALLIVTFVAASMVGVATRAGLAARRDAIEIVHGLGATDGTIAGQFARRVSVLVLVGACLGVVLAVPVLLALTHLAAPFSTVHGLDTAPSPPPDQARNPALAWSGLPPLLWALLACLPLAAVLIAWATAQTTVHGWLRRLP